ncbi:MAG: hypothetical protein OEV42_08295 [Deltaproteobacteria bacterium]|nr:hypothetical protein [Deltaproteobacteria bacterium]
MNLINVRNFITIQKKITYKFTLFKGFVLGSLILVFSSAAAANPGYKVFFDGGGSDAGSIVGFGGAPEVPEGVCGMRISATALLDSFYWAEYSEFTLGSPMQEPPFGPPSSATYDFPEEDLEAVIEFTGPLGNNCEDEWVFHLPLTGDWPTWANGTPQGGGALVFNVLPNEIDWLDSGFQVWEEPGEDPTDQEEPEFANICDAFPDLCVEPGFAYDSPCNSRTFEDLCNDYSEIDKLSLQGEHLMRSAVEELAGASGKQYLNKYKKAHAAVSLAMEESLSLGKVSQRIENTNLRYTENRNKASVSVGIIEVVLRSCQATIKDRIRNSDTSKISLKDEANLLVKRCGTAIELLRSVRDVIRHQYATTEEAK